MISYTKLVLFCCMAIEAFLNYYGVRRLGEAFFKENIERLGAVQKIKTLIAICFNKLYRDNSPHFKEIKYIFELRNSFVHAKTKEIPMSFITEKPHVFERDSYTVEMGNCIFDNSIAFMKWFAKFDPKLYLDFKA